MSDFLQGLNLPEDEFEECNECGGEGFIENDCFEDTCCCADPEASHGLRRCPVCNPAVRP